MVWLLGGRSMRPVLVMSLALSAVGCARSTDDWLRQLKDTDVVKRREAVRELSSMSSEAGRVVPALSEALGDESGYVRHDAAMALGKFGPDARPAVAVLVAARKDQEPRVRKAAAESLKRIDPEAAAKAGVR
jgi:HEAT repeat protein